MPASIAPSPIKNRFARALSYASHLPEPLRLRLVGFAFGLYTPYFRTNRCKLITLQQNQVSIAINLKRHVRNHIGGIHAVAATLAAEYASGLLIGQHVPDSAIVVVKTIHVELRKPNKGRIIATAKLSDLEIQQLKQEPKGSIKVPITIEDAQAQTPITGFMEMAWFPKKK